jgi:hypothetical protein
VISDPDATPGVYKIPVQATYQDPASNQYSRNSTISVIIATPPSIAVTLSSSDVLTPGSTGSFTISVTNRGLSTVQRMLATIGTSGQYSLISPPQAYLGDIETNDFQTTQVTAFVNTSAGTINVPVSVDYLDSFNRETKQSFTVPVRVYSPAEVAALQLGGAQSSMPELIGVIVLLVVLYLAYRWWRGRRSRE